jgi:mRNA interferase RelE/StbE
MTLFFARIERKILALAVNPLPAGCKKLKGYKDQRRIRVGDRRVLYIIDNETRTVIVMHVAHRSEVLRIDDASVTT